MTHSDIRLTMKTYADPKMFDVADAVNSMPEMNSARGSERSTEPNEDEEADSDEQLVPNLARVSPKRSSGVNLATNTASSAGECNVAETTEKQRKSPIRRVF